jgi:predicted RNase H-like HicB family nuclease
MTSYNSLLIEQGDEPLRQVILYPGEDGYWVVECPSLPGCISQGTTKEEAIASIKEAIDLYIEDMIGSGESVPEDHLDRLVVVV